MPSTANKQLLRAKEMNLLVSILIFETYWAYYSMSSGTLYKKVVRDAAKHLLDSIDELAALHKGILDKKSLNWTDAAKIEDIVQNIREWLNGGSDLPYETFLRSRVHLWLLLTHQKLYLLTCLGIKSPPPIVWEAMEFVHSERYLRWQPHLPSESMYEYDKTLDISMFSTSRTIVIYGDIRRSQDLMIYTIGQDRFEEMMVRFFDSVRNIFDKSIGIFDKFTGDGFLGYFNEYLCGERGKNFEECFVTFVKQCMEFSESLFREWKRHVRKLPDENIMLSIGADLGEIYFGDRGGHLVCIGDAIVWAQRMCSAAPAGAVYINNLLANLLVDREGIELLPVTGNTKTGETFLASELRIAH